MDTIEIDIHKSEMAKVVNDAVSTLTSVFEGFTGEKIPFYVKGVTEEEPLPLDEVNDEILDLILKEHSPGKKQHQFTREVVSEYHKTYSLRLTIPDGEKRLYTIYLPNLAKIYDGFGSLSINLSGIPYETKPILKKDMYVARMEREISVQVAGKTEHEITFTYNYYGTGEAPDVSIYAVVSSLS